MILFTALGFLYSSVSSLRTPLSPLRPSVPLRLSVPSTAVCLLYGLLPHLQPSTPVTALYPSMTPYSFYGLCPSTVLYPLYGLLAPLRDMLFSHCFAK